MRTIVDQPSYVLQVIENFNETRPLGVTRFEVLGTKKVTAPISIVLGVSAFVIFTLLSLPRTARQCGIFSFISLSCFASMLGLIGYFLFRQCFENIDVPHNHENITNPEHQLLDSFSILYLKNHRLLFTQAVGGVSLMIFFV